MSAGGGFQLGAVQRESASLVRWLYLTGVALQLTPRKESTPAEFVPITVACVTTTVGGPDDVVSVQTLAPVDEDDDDLDVESVPKVELDICLLYTSPSPRDRTRSRMPSSA